MSTPNQPGKDEKPQTPSASSTPPPQRPGQTTRPDADSGSQRPSEQTPSGRPPLPPLPPRQSGTPTQQSPAARPPEPPRKGAEQAPTGSSPQRPASPRPAEASGQNVRGTQAPPWQRGAAGQGSQSGQAAQAPQSGQAPQKPAGSGTGTAPAAKTPPAGPQREPQTNLKRPEPPKSGAGQTGAQKQAPAAGQKPAPPGSAQGQSAKAATPRPTPPQAGSAAKAGPQRVAPPQKSAPPAPGQPKPAEQREAAKAKAAAIDGPTRHIDRKTLPKDMPDLSEAKHPLPAAQASTTGQQAKVAATAVPQRVAEGEALRATVQLRKIDPWSMLKISSIISVSLFFVWMVAVGLLYIVLDGMGVWDRLNNAFTDIVSESGSEGLVTAGQVFGYAAIIGLVNMVLMTALATIGSFIYNMCSDLVGGLEVTLADRD
ncbi:DUF3566 domain-containing protein [Rhodococcus sp. NPDC058521]|uniref:DUF3566 domain-containing protein n=1 Tax=Rhodococcus sp. NPDC058521 TaxID=3346536 RepID=UPI0036575948